MSLIKRQLKIQRTLDFPGAGGGGKRATATSSGGARGSEPAQEERAGGGLRAPCLLLALEGAQKHLPPRLPLYQHPLQNQSESPRRVQVRVVEQKLCATSVRL